MSLHGQKTRENCTINLMKFDTLNFLYHDSLENKRNLKRYIIKEKIYKNCL